MKKRNLKTLRLNKKLVSKISELAKGGRDYPTYLSLPYSDCWCWSKDEDTQP
ncbi:hypothetical protein KORDIASMS9_02078 [Kordia sp. SMS9]|uniref:hypothetical protein n=1 Tax=Kordia sp. SMS9 TaxID=2282170 RepID=UPI000E105ED1|nr:hypothetical protein [Kordia sp. SMS9]AXG69850.1 hypothetical protein KORDIASMS9_02078 [Kordia sp. SMS9]